MKRHMLICFFIFMLVEREKDLWNGGKLLEKVGDKLLRKGLGFSS